MWFSFAFPWWFVILSTFSLALWVSSWEKCLFKFYAHFWIGLFFGYWFVWVAYNFEYWLLIWYMVCKYFVLFYRLPFHFVHCFFCCLCRSFLVNCSPMCWFFYFVACAFGVIAKESLPRLVSRRLFQCFLWGGLQYQVLCLSL